MALSPEEKANIQNILSLINQLMQMEEGSDSVGGGDLVPVEKEDKKDMGDDFKPKDDVVVVEDDEKKDEMLEKAISKALRKMIAKADEGSTGSDTAEEKIDDIPEIDEDNIDEVAKAILAIANRKKIAKSKSTNSVAKIEKAIIDLTNVMKSVVDDQKEIGDALTNFLDAQGILDEVKKSMGKDSQIVGNNSGSRRVQKSESDLPIAERSSVRKALREELISILGVKKEEGDEEAEQIQKTGDVRKGLSSVLKSLLS